MSRVILFLVTAARQQVGWQETARTFITLLGTDWNTGISRGRKCGRAWKEPKPADFLAYTGCHSVVDYLVLRAALLNAE